MWSLAYGQDPSRFAIPQFSQFLAVGSPRYLMCICPWMNHSDCHHFADQVKVKIKGQGHYLVISGSRRNPYFFSSFDRINFILGGNVAYGQALSWLVFGGDRPWPLKFRRSRIKLTPRSNFHIAGTISYNTRVLSESVKILAIWRHLTTQWHKNHFFTQYFISSFLDQMWS